MLNESEQADAVGHGRPVEGIPAINGGEDVNGNRMELAPPVPDFMRQLPPHAREAVEDFLAVAVVGGPQRVATGLQDLHAATEADEFMVVCDIFDPAARLRSLDITAQALRSVATATA